MKFWAELRRRHVVRVAVVYLIAAWLMVQVAGALEPALGLPAWFDTLIVALLALCFPAAIVLAWAFELTPDGVKRAAPALSGPADSPLAPPAASSGAEHAAPILATGPGLHGVEGTRSIAVLPFVNMSPDPDQEYFSDGLSEELLNQLAQIEDLRVAARTSSFYFKGKDVDLREVASKLGVSHVLEGSVRKAGDRLR
ncbi:MAG TPA: adenylyl cyclase, partial [Gammaproteobacteria bacterium]|nr:adenylyl cyclase [Gammaproteobacteria bacterium]